MNGDWLIRRPEAFSARDAMAIGTAGYTAMLCVMALQAHGITPSSGPVLVTGANGGVGSIAVALLSRLGFEVHAGTGRPEQAEHLKALGAARIVERSSLDAPGKPLQKEVWAAAVDSVGSHTLANVCASLRYGGCVAACGLAQGLDLPASVAPFILRGVSLLGIDSVYAPAGAARAGLGAAGCRTAARGAGAQYRRGGSGRCGCAGAPAACRPGARPGRHRYGALRPARGLVPPTWRRGRQSPARP